MSPVCLETFPLDSLPKYTTMTKVITSSITRQIAGPKVPHCGKKKVSIAPNAILWSNRPSKLETLFPIIMEIMVPTMTIKNTIRWLVSGTASKNQEPQKIPRTNVATFSFMLFTLPRFLKQYTLFLNKNIGYIIITYFT